MKQQASLQQIAKGFERGNLEFWNLVALTISVRYVTIGRLCLVQVLLSLCF
jgi:hypothetical protein